MKSKIPKIVYGVPIVILSAIILNLALNESNIELSSSTPLMNSNSDDFSENFDYSSNNLYSGPFAILKGTYDVDDTVFLIGDKIPLNSKGEIDIIRPDGRIHHSLQFDGSKNAVNHYFTPVLSSDLEECSECEFFGTWEISFRSKQGISYESITFEVIDSTKNVIDNQ